MFCSWQLQLGVSDILLMPAILLLLVLPVNLANANDVLAQIGKQLIKAPLTQGKFRQEKRLKFLTKPLISSGTFVYHQSQGVIWQTQSPVQSTLVIGDAAMLSGDDKQNLPPAFGALFKSLLGGAIVTLSQNFTVTGKQKGQSWALELKPNDEMLKKVISTITISGDNEVRDWALQETGGNQTHIHFFEITHPERLSDQQQTDFARLSP